MKRRPEEGAAFFLELHSIEANRETRRRFLESHGQFVSQILGVLFTDGSRSSLSLTSIRVRPSVAEFTLEKETIYGAKS
jgi:hypothetical protein